ncbi:MAG TPA: hypothetical protein VIL65_04590 [Beijerinckiaceae bacterium]|jgi:hypothetical protein
MLSTKGLFTLGCFGKLRAATVAAMLLLGFSATAFPSSPTSGRYRIIPVADSAPTEADVGDAWRLVTNVFNIPGLPGPVFTPNNRGGEWTILDRRLVRYEGSYPKSFLDRGNLVTEPWSGRKVAVTYATGALSVLPTGANAFSTVPRPEALRQNPRGPYLLPRAQATLVVSDGQAYVVEANSIRPWERQEELRAKGIPGVRSVHDAPSIRATVVVDMNQALHVLADEGTWTTNVDELNKDDYGSVTDVPRANAVLFMANTLVLSIHRSGRGGFTARTLATKKTYGASFPFLRSAIFGDVLRYGAGNFFDFGERWRRIGPEGWQEIPGGDVGIHRPGPNATGRIQDLPTLGRTLIFGREGLHLYDGERMIPVPDSGAAHLGDFPRIYDLSAIGRVVVSTSKGLFELGRDGRLAALRMPFSTEGLSPPDLADWPHGGVGVVSTREGIYLLDRDLNPERAAGGELIAAGLQPTLGENPGTGELMLLSSRGLALLVDAERGGGDACAEARRIKESYPPSSVCLRPVPGSDTKEFGDIVGSMTEAPEGRGVLIESRGGLFHLPNDGHLVSLERQMGCCTRSLIPLSWSGDVFASGVTRAVIGRDLSFQVLEEGQVPKVVAVLPTLRTVLIQAGVRPIQALRGGPDGYRLETFGLPKKPPGELVDAPWFETVLSFNSDGITSIDAKGEQTPFSLQGFPTLKPAERWSFSRRPFGALAILPLPRLRSILIHEKGWWRITPDRRWEEVSGLPDVNLLTSYDPGSCEVLLGTSRGVFALSESGFARKLVDAEGGPSRAVRAIGASPAGGVLVGGQDGLFAAPADLSTLARPRGGHSDQLGAVLSIAEARFARLTMVEASTGSYTVEPDGVLRAAAAFSPVGQYARLRAFENVRKAFTASTKSTGPILFEVGRRTNADTCGSL